MGCQTAEGGIEVVHRAGGRVGEMATGSRQTESLRYSRLESLRYKGAGTAEQLA